MPDHKAIKAVPADAPRMISSLVAAFASDPFIAGCFPTLSNTCGHFRWC